MKSKQTKNSTQGLIALQPTLARNIAFHNTGYIPVFIDCVFNGFCSSFFVRRLTFYFFKFSHPRHLFPPLVYCQPRTNFIRSTRFIQYPQDTHCKEKIYQLPQHFLPPTQPLALNPQLVVVIYASAEYTTRPVF